VALGFELGLTMQALLPLGPLYQPQSSSRTVSALTSYEFGRLYIQTDTMITDPGKTKLEKGKCSRVLYFSF
jgi:hypothetical protein